MLVPVPYRVLERVEEQPDVVTLHVVPVEGELPRFQPAQCGMIGLFGLGDAPISISSDPAERSFHAYTIRKAGAITSGLVDLPVGEELIVRAPFGNCWPLDHAVGRDLVVVAGGIGLAPLRSAIYTVIRRRDEFASVSLVVGAKTPDTLLYADEFPVWAERGLDVVATADEPQPGWAGRLGLVTEWIETAGLDWPNTTALLCGPDVMMHHTARALLSLGVSDSSIHLTLERNMQCGNGLCGHCQLGPIMVCRHGTVTSYADIGHYHRMIEV